MDQPLLDQIRHVALALPGVIEKPSHGAPCFFTGNGRPICYFHDQRGSDGCVTIWCPAPPGVAEDLSAADPVRFFRPQPSAGGVFGQWLGVVLDPAPPGGTDWAEVDSVLETAFRMTARKRDIAALENR